MNLLRSCPKCGYSPSGKNRSTPQNKYYWSVVVKILSEETGYTTDEIHEIIKYKFLSERKLFREHKGLQTFAWIAKSTTILDTKEFEELMTKIREWASQVLGIWIPEPNEEIPNEQK